MAGPAPKTKMWTARENKQEDALVLVVCGQVEVTNTGLVPKLAEGGPLRDPHSLNLELTIVDSGHPATDVVVWMPASVQKDVKHDQYHDVVVRWDGEKIAQFAVFDDHEHSALMDKQSQAQKTVAKVAAKPKPPVAKKVSKNAAKKAAKKTVKKAVKKTSKKTPRAVGGWAKGAKAAKKKVAKKVAKKAAAKKSARGAKKKAKGKKR